MRIRYADYLRRTQARPVVVDFSALTRRRREAPARRRPAFTLTDLRRILGPYLGGLTWEQVRAVAPLALYLALFQVLILRAPLGGPEGIALGLLTLVGGLMLFLEGLRVGLMPFGEAIGHALPRRLTLRAVLAVTVVLGVGVTYAEPAFAGLRAAGALVRAEATPYLYALLNLWPGLLVACVSLGVGAGAALGVLRFLRGWSLKPMLFVVLAGLLALTLACAAVPGLAEVLPLAWDVGVVTTGPITVPLMLALGLGVSAAAGEGEGSLAGFGIITLTGLLPVAAVLLFALGVAAFHTPAEIIAAARAADAAADAAGGGLGAPWAEVIGGLQAIVPLVAFLVVVARYLLRTRLDEPALTAFGILLTLAGIILFNLGLTYGLVALGQQSGGLVPGAFAALDGVAGTPLFPLSVGLTVAFAFAGALGFGATLAEPALAALGQTVETLTNGALKRRLLILAVSAGVTFGMVLGLAKLVFGWPLLWLLLPAYGAALLLTLLSSETFVNVAWDAAGVTTGPVTVPLVLALGLAFGSALGAAEGFGILTMVAIGPILSVLLVGLWVRLRLRRLERAAAAVL